MSVWMSACLSECSSFFDNATSAAIFILVISTARVVAQADDVGVDARIGMLLVVVVELLLLLVLHFVLHFQLVVEGGRK